MALVVVEKELLLSVVSATRMLVIETGLMAEYKKHLISVQPSNFLILEQQTDSLSAVSEQDEGDSLPRSCSSWAEKPRRFLLMDSPPSWAVRQTLASLCITDLMLLSDAQHCCLLVCGGP